MMKTIVCKCRLNFQAMHHTSDCRRIEKHAQHVMAVYVSVIIRFDAMHFRDNVRFEILHF